MRPSRRQPDELRAVSLERGVVKYAEGSCFVKFGDTHVLVTATLEDRLPPWLKGQARGWVTAEYGMLPRATHERTRREASAGKQSGRTVEIQRLIGRSLRAVVDLPALGERQITHRLRRDPGRRRHPHRRDHRRLGRAARLHRLDEGRATCSRTIRCATMSPRSPAASTTAPPVLDLDYAEDSEAETDANFVMTGAGNIVEVQATAEKDAVQRGAVAGAARARPQGHRQAGRPAEAGGDVSDGRIARSPAASSSPPTIRASSPRCASCWRPTASRPYRRASWACPSRRRPARRFRANARIKAEAAAQGVGPAGVRRRFRARGRCARRRSPASIRRAGPGRTRTFGRAMETIEAMLRERGAKSAGAPRAAHFVSALCVAWPDGHVEEFEATVDGTLVWPPRGDRGLRLRSDVPAGRL